MKPTKLEKVIAYIVIYGGLFAFYYLASPHH